LHQTIISFHPEIGVRRKVNSGPSFVAKDICNTLFLVTKQEFLQLCP